MTPAITPSDACAVLLAEMSRESGDPTPLRMAQAIRLGIPPAAIRLCPGCGKYFQAGLGTGHRVDAKTCSNRCRQAARRREHSSRRGRA